MQSAATTVAQYLKELPADQRSAIEAVRAVILENLPKGYVEEMHYGGIGYVVPHTLYPAGYHCDPKKPLSYAGLASQKNYMAVYLMNVYDSKEVESWFQKAYKATGKRLDMGKCCVRFKKLDDLPLELVGQAIARTPVSEFIANYMQLDPRLKPKK